MFKAVFFDWFNTLAVYHPPREVIHSQAIRENGYSISTETVKTALFAADEFLFQENISNPIRLRSRQEAADLYTEYERILLTDAGIDVSNANNIAFTIYKRARDLSENIGFALYDDVLSVLSKLKEQHYITGLITNIEQDMQPICRGLGILEYLDHITTSGEAGSDKPQRGIFTFALNKAGVSPKEAIHVGDQYDSDIIGARGVGIEPVMIDRNNNYPDIRDCRRIKDLEEIFDLL